MELEVVHDVHPITQKQKQHLEGPELQKLEEHRGSKWALGEGHQLIDAVDAVEQQHHWL